MVLVNKPSTLYRTVRNIANIDRPSFIAELSSVSEFSSGEKANQFCDFLRTVLDKHAPPSLRNVVTHQLLSMVLVNKPSTSYKTVRNIANIDRQSFITELSSVSEFSSGEKANQFCDFLRTVLDKHAPPSLWNVVTHQLLSMVLVYKPSTLYRTVRNIANIDRPSFIAELSSVSEFSSGEKANQFCDFLRTVLDKHAPPSLWNVVTHQLLSMVLVNKPSTLYRTVRNIANIDRQSFIAELSSVSEFSSGEKANQFCDFLRIVLDKHAPPSLWNVVTHQLLSMV